MMKKIYIIAIIILLGNECFAQVNLVQNGSFEEFTTCPMSSGEIYLAKYWWAPSGSPDYYHICSNNQNVPYEFYGFQFAKEGGAIAAIALWGKYGIFREYIETKLSQPLVNGKKYCVAFYVNLADMSTFATDKIGACFTADTLKPTEIDSLTFASLIDKNPQINNKSGNIISDTVNWVKVSGEFIAQGNEQFLTIGNFYNDSNTNVDTVNATSTWGWAYYFIDDVSVYYCVEDTTGVNELNKNGKVSEIYPNPTKDMAYLDYSLTEGQTAYLYFYNTMGTPVKSFTLNSQSNRFEFSTKDFKNGLYFYRIVLNNNQLIESNKLIIIK